MTIQVAIAGGGIAGLCLARGLLQYPQFDVQVYEQVQQHRDKGGALALHANAIRAMELIDPALKQAYFRKANSMLADDEVEMATRVIMMEGKYMGEVIASLGRAKGRKTVTRLDLVAGYQELLPKERVHMGRKLVDAEETGNGKIQLSFADGSTTTADCLIGADGVRSVSRKYVLGKDHPAALPVNHDRWYRIGTTFPVEVVEKTISPRLQGFVPLLAGSKGTLALTPVRYGKVINISVYQRAETDEDIGKLANPEDFRDYDPDCVKMVEMINGAFNREEIWAIQDHDPAPFFNKGSVAMMGDAAHATMPFIGNGAAQALEDAAVIQAVFAHVENRSQIPAALAAFDEVRRPRSQRVVEMSRVAGRIYTYQFDEFWKEEDGIEALKENWKKWASFTNDADMETQNQMAVSAFLRRTVPSESNSSGGRG